MTTTTAPRTATADRERAIATGRNKAFDAEVIGRQAVYTTTDGERLVGTVERDPRQATYLRVVFADGRWARLNDRIETVTR